MVALIFILVIVVTLVFVFLNNLFVDQLRQRFMKNHPEEWKAFLASKPRFYFPGRAGSPWGYNTGAMSQFIDKTPALAKDAAFFKEHIRRITIMRTIGIVVIISLIVVARILAGP